jgi:hypothetical protein
MSEIKRMRYFRHEFLDAEDFNDEQEYHRQMRYRHNRDFHTWGIGHGLEVSLAEDQETGNETKVTVSPGTAVDGDGKEIILPISKTIDFNDYQAGMAYYITIRWDQQGDLPRQEDEFKRWQEIPQVNVTGEEPLDRDMELILVLVTLRGDNTIEALDYSNRTDASSQIAEGHVGTAELADNAVTNSKIENGSVSENKLDAATKGKLVSGGDNHTHRMSQLSDYNANNNKITNLQDPAEDKDAANKNYVDSRTVGGTISSTDIINSDSTGHSRQINVSNAATVDGDWSQVNASENSKAIGDRTQVNASVESTAGGLKSQVNASDNSTATNECAQTNASGGANASGLFSQVNASHVSTASGTRSQVNASDSSTASGLTSQVNASGSGTASAQASQVNASIDSSATAKRSQVNASDWSTANNDCAQVNASHNSTASGPRSQVNASGQSYANGNYSQVNASYLSIQNGRYSQITGSMRVTNNDDFALSGGYSTTGDASTANMRWTIWSTTGNVYISGTVHSGTPFGDYGEYFENLKNGEINVGLLIALEGAKVRPAKKDEDFIGVVSGTAGIRLGDTPFCWQGRYLVDEWGRTVYEEIKDPDWEPGEGETEKDRPLIRVQKENPDYDPQKKQEPRSERPGEWTLVGLVGQVYVRCDGTIEPGDFVRSKGRGIGTKSPEKTRLRAMKVAKEYDGSYSIVYCLLL